MIKQLARSISLRIEEAGVGSAVLEFLTLSSHSCGS
jgi:hypothetical protein